LHLAEWAFENNEALENKFVYYDVIYLLYVI